MRISSWQWRVIRVRLERSNTNVKANASVGRRFAVNEHVKAVEDEVKAKRGVGVSGMRFRFAVEWYDMTLNRDLTLWSPKHEPRSPEQ